MNQEDLARALHRVSKCTIGIHEAAALFAIPLTGTTYEQITERLGAKRQVIKTRFAVLRRKGLVSTRYGMDGTPIHRPSDLGKKVIRAALGTSTDPTP